MSNIPTGISKNSYNPKSKKDSQDKLFANCIYQSYVNSTEQHLFLESENGLTTACLKNKGVRPNDMFVVNGNPDTCKTIKKFIPSENVICDMSTNFLQTTKRRFQTIWMDYCCTMEGNKFFKPIDDFYAILSRKVIADGGIIGFTFSIRQPKKHWSNCSVRKHKLATQDIVKNSKYKIFKKIQDRKKSRWEHNAIDFCETVLEKTTKCKIDIVDFYRYQFKNGKAPPQMYVFFAKISWID